jgi:hypothetical protein
LHYASPGFVYPGIKQGDNKRLWGVAGCFPAGLSKTVGAK